MQKSLPQRVHESIKEHLRHKRWRRVVTALACVVVFCTTYALILPAITMTGDTYCGKEEHTHTLEECYERVLICGYGDSETETVHQHTDTCYETRSVLVCGQEERSAHTHSAECYTKESSLSCGLEEDEDHTHDESCYTETETLTCGLAETEGHTHDESCYQEERVLVCTESTDGSVETQHVHTDACYEERLICEKEEHTHSLICYSNPNADVESASYWESTLPQSLGDNWAENVVAVAKSQLGYMESTANYTVLEDGVTMKGYTRYGAWYGMPYDDWCAMFASFCLHYAGVPQTSVPYASGCIYWVEQLQAAGLFDTSFPEPGFLVFFDTDGDGLANHVGIVTEVAEDGGTISTIEGNIGGAVVTRSYSESDGSILGYGVLPQNPNAQADEAAIDPAAILPDDVVDSGTFESVEGNEMTWTVTQDISGEYTITIAGTGAMPSFAATPRPWNAYKTSNGCVIKEIIFSDGVTRIGNNSFNDGFSIRKLTIADSVKEIGVSAFRLCSYLDDVLEIPGTVEAIEGGAFEGTALKTIKLNEGTKTVGQNTFTGASGATVYIPSTLQTIGNRAFRNMSGFVVAEGSQYFTTDEDGIGLYTKDMTQLLSFAQGRYIAEYKIPDSVTYLGYTVMATDNCEKVVIPTSVARSWEGIGGRYKEIIFEDGTGNEPSLELSGYTAWGGSNSDDLVAYHLPQNRPLVLGKLINGNSPNLTDFEIPNGVTSFKTNLTDGSMMGLERLRYNAKSATFAAAAANPCGPNASFALTIGDEVDMLAEGFSYFVNHATSIVFEPNNQITIAEGAFANAPAPLTGLSGTVYVDSQGVVYSYDATAGTAKLVYVPGNVTSVTIPATITPEDGVTCTVTSVGANALSLAGTLTGITFEAPSAITEIGAYGLANCPTLTSVNGKTTVEEASATFTNAAKGYGILDNTGLTGSSGGGTGEDSMSGGKDLTLEKADKSYLEIKVASKGETLQWKENEDGAGGYTILTGDTMTITAAAGNTAGSTEYVYRVYLQKSTADCVLNVSPGETYTFNGNTVTCYATDDPNTVYLEFVPGIGNTLSFPVTAVYPSPTSAGGGLTIWGEILTGDDAEDKTSVRKSDTKIEAFWKTQCDPYELTKTLNGAESISITAAADGAARPASSLVWNVKLNRNTDTTSAYGKDIAKSVDFTDQLTLPTGLHWTQTVLDAAQSGGIRTSGNDIYAGAIKIATITGTNWSGRGAVLSEDGGNLVFRWKYTNTSNAAELGSSTGTITVYPEALEADLTTFTEDSTTLTNTANATVHYTYSADDTLEATVDRTLTPQKGALTLSKSAEGGYYFGEDITYTVTLKNTGLTNWTGEEESYFVRDTLSKYSYISPENMERMFNEAYGGKLTITISNATLAEWQQVTGAIGETTSYRTSGNSDIGTSSQTLTVTKSEDGYTVSVTNGGTYTGATATQALQSAGYAVSVNAAYTCQWTLDQGEAEMLTIPKGTEYTFMIYAAAKDTFGMLPKDWPGEYASAQAVSVVNTAKLIGKTDGKEAVQKSASAQTKTHREAVISKSIYDENNTELNSYTVSDGAVLNYQLDFTHYGDGEYDNLPMVDDLYGSQYLLVRADMNSGLADKGLETKVSGGVTYYVLTEGEYTNIVVGEDDEENWLTAATVTVTRTDTEQTEGTTGNSYTGTHTQIKWYFAHLDGGHYRKSVRYQAVEDLSITGVSYSLGNIVWMNDRTNDRIYASVSWGNGTLIEFDKSLVETKGDTPAQDVLDADDYSIIAPGDAVTYRLTLKSDGDTNYTISGKDIVDMLPETYDVFKWEKGTNISLEVVTTVNVEATGLENWSLVDGTETSIGLTGGRQCMVWPEETQITFRGKGAVYLYITLNFPTDTEGSSDTWSQYAAKNAGMILDNTLYVYRFPDSVEHELRESGAALLQKGVLSVVWHSGNRNMRAGGSDRQHYVNKDGSERVVFYYVALYNGGNTRLYLSDLQDRLPEGFTFFEMEHNAARFDEGDSWYIYNGYGAYTNEGKTSVAVNLGDENVTYRRAYVTAEPSADSRSVTFHISGGGGSYPLKYDEKQGQYYLDHGEALVFSYAASVGTAEETEDTATNTIAMPYTDHLSTGVTLLDKDSVSVNAVTGGCFTDLNDGDRRVMSGSAVQQQYGFTGGEKQWLVSSVSQQRGGIVPGITKYTESYTNNQSGMTYDYTNSVGPTDTVNWRVRVQNTGTASMTDYTVTDVMPEPYVFTGEVKYTIYDAKGRSLFTGTFLTFDGTRTGSEESVSVKNGWEGGTTTLSMDGMEVWLDKGQQEISAAMSRDAKGNECLTLHIQTLKRSIPEGGYMDLTFSSVNPTNNYTNSVYVNQATVTPNKQTFTNAGQGSIVRDDSGKAVSVRNSSPVTVTFGYATSSEKRVTETENTNNTAVSTDVENNWILLPSANSEFHYMLTVHNDTDKAMTKLVLIDNLPEVGDHSPFDSTAERNSEFNVNFAAEPNITVSVTTEDGTTSTLDGQYYTVEYSTSTDFGGQQSADWKGENTGKWIGSSVNARSMRIVITDEDGAQIPAKATVSVSFSAVVGSNAESGKIAWNSFGYHYGLVDTQAELEAMPLVVGVKIPSVPTLKKQLVNDLNQPIAAETDVSFRFLIYEGEALSGYDTEDALKAALTEAGRRYMETTLTVNAGASESETTKLLTEAFTWTEGQKYTAVELTGETEAYRLSGFVGADKTVTFTYHAASDVVLICRNTLWQWSINLIKVDGSNTQTKLPGAVFALYSPNAEDKLDVVPDGYSELGIQTEITAEEATWYLYDVKTTDENGAAQWAKLSCESYYLLEVKAPDAYNLPENPGQLLHRDDAVQSICTVTVQNTPGYALPKTGGAGTALFTIGGTLLLAGSLLLGYVLRRKRERRFMR